MLCPLSSWLSLFCFSTLSPSLSLFCLLFLFWSGMAHRDVCVMCLCVECCGLVVRAIVVVLCCAVLVVVVVCVSVGAVSLFLPKSNPRVLIQNASVC